ncbi:class I SAM-dependent methyltransferase [Streptomyces sp. YIM 98790]|uniref:SAM-dependent methyltransferase n=1 Tax=Streptomyces sp. YIM 98790 TaxID=2689077 RepID=UPI0028BE7919|nr:class I SAM-dependent methyltransferase [Streptomyces sp. YIM 98790]
MSDRPHTGVVSTAGEGLGTVPTYYSSKTDEIIRKYGGSRRGAPHFHLGLFNETHPTSAAGQEVIRRRICESQEAMLDHAAHRWGVTERPPRDLLDIGCGLGGGSLYWAQEHGARVTALTNTAAHVPHLWDFIRAGGVSDLVSPMLLDIHDLREERRYDAAVAIESSGYMDRQRLFPVVARALRPGGWFGIEEHFLTSDRWAGYLDGYYKTRLGTLDEYLTAAGEAGFVLEDNDDLTERVTEFWVQSMAWSVMELEQSVPQRPGAEPAGPTIIPARLAESARRHSVFFRLWRDREVETRLLLFRLPSHRP